MLEDEIPEQEQEPEQEEEFEDYDSTGQIWADLCASHKGLKIRLGLLTVITAIRQNFSLEQMCAKLKNIYLKLSKN